MRRSGSLLRGKGEFRRFWVSTLLALVFGTAYNRLIDVWSERDDHPFWTSVQVAVGTAGTLLIAAIWLGPGVILRVLWIFGGTGLPMILGAKLRGDRRGEVWWRRANGHH